MATYPTQYPWTLRSFSRYDQGINQTRMLGGQVHSQSYYSVTAVDFTVAHENLDPADADAIIAFLNANIGTDFTLTDQLSGATYTGQQVGPISRPYDSSTHYGLRWPFAGVVA